MLGYKDLMMVYIYNPVKMISRSYQINTDVFPVAQIVKDSTVFGIPQQVLQATKSVY